MKSFIDNANNILVLTGAGISTESGIADYRSKGGLWQRFKPVTFQEFCASHEKRVQYWKIKGELICHLDQAQPNDGHRAIVTLEKMGKLKGLVTQNIDGLHKLAGTSTEKLCEIHGTCLETVCLSCGDIQPWQHVAAKLKEGIEVPLCDLCQGFLKPNTISFGQSLKPDVLAQAFDWARDCDLCLVIGSTLVVEPAASIPRIARDHGARLVILTMSETPLDGVADLKIEEPIGQSICKLF